MICPDCEGKGIVIALVDGSHYCGPMCVSCSRCEGTGEADPQTEDEGAGPSRPVLLEMLEKLRATDGGGKALGGALSPQQLDELLARLQK